MIFTYVPVPTGNEKLIDNFKFIASGNCEYRPRGGPKVTRFQSYRDQLDADAEAEGAALKRLDRNDSDGVSQRRARKGRR